MYICKRLRFRKLNKSPILRKSNEVLSVQTRRLFKLLNAVGKQVTSKNGKRKKTPRENTATEPCAKPLFVHEKIGCSL